MKRTIRPDLNPGFGRRGVTLVEMLVTVAMLVIIMTILVQVFQAATGALTAATTVQQLDDQLKLLDSTIRSDLGGATAKFTPPLDPAQNLGYFEYGENEFADLQGEDSDDYIRFTAQAPPGRPFTGRMWVNSTGSPPWVMNNEATQPATITSDYAEIIYFLRNGNLYRRVLLIAPELQSSIVPAIGNVPYSYPLGLSGGQLNLPNGNTFSPAALGGTAVSWQAVNDLSARPAATGPNSGSGTLSLASQAATTIVLNTLGDLTNRENRFAYSRFASDFQTVTIDATGNATYVPGPDGIPDDVNGDNVPDYYPTLYQAIFPAAAGGLGTGPLNQLIYEPNYNNFSRGFLGLMGFPFVFPGAYSQPQSITQVNGGDRVGWIHAPAPYAFVRNATGCTATQFDASPLAYLESMNHNPLDIGDNLPTQNNSGTNSGSQTPVQLETTWWGFPTWRETLSPAWTDPTVQVNVGAFIATSALPAQPQGLVPLTPGPGSEVASSIVNNYPTRALLPPMTSFWRNNPDPFCDGFGATVAGTVATSAFFSASNASGLWNTLSWEDDLIMTGVRSFDVKAYDNALGGFGDLGWGDDLRLYVPYQTTQGYLGPFTVAPYLGYVSGTAIPSFPYASSFTVWPPVSPGGTPFVPLTTLAHEGRMPPLIEDNRLDYQFPNPNYQSFNNFVAQYPAFPNYSSNIGDDNSGIVRLRRVWDTWSTEYSKAPATGINNTANIGFPAGPPFTPPIYPSYPPPYPAPLRGIQIQIRVADPTNQRIKSLTIRQDFTDKL